MATTFTKEPEGIYPAYNDSFIEFSSDLVDNYKAEITIFPTEFFTRNFIIYPDADGIYLFNLKEPVKSIFNQDGFEDANFFTDFYWKSISNLYLSQYIEIKIYNDTTSETVPKTYEFIKSVKQVGESTVENPFKLLTYTPNGVDHKLTYFEGFPFHFDIQNVQYVAGKYIKVKSLNTGAETEQMFVTSTGAFRINIDRGNGGTWTVDNVLPLINGVNRLEIYENTTFKTNLLLTKKKSCSGIYIKWFNREGGFSHFLFNENFNENIKGRDIGIIANTDFQNINEVTGAIKSIGKETERSFVIRSKYNQDEYEMLKDIFISPLIQIYTSTEAHVEGRFIDVIVNGTFSHNNKKEFNDIVLNVELPEMITAKY